MITLKYNFSNDDILYEFKPNQLRINSALRTILSEFKKEDLIELVMDSMDENCFEEELAEYFEKEAYDEYRETCDYKKDPYGYYGLNERDFH